MIPFIRKILLFKSGLNAQWNGNGGGKSMYAALLAILLLAALPVRASEGWDVTITVTDGVASQELIVGLYPEATGEFDDGRDQLAPPEPPSSAFDTRIVTAQWDFYTYYRPDTLEPHPFEITYDKSDEGETIELSWDPVELPEGWTLTLVDPEQQGQFELAMADTTGLTTSASETIASRILLRATPDEEPEEDPRPFITVWQTDNEGISEDHQITIPGTGTDYLIEWQQVEQVEGQWEEVDGGHSGSQTGTDEHTVAFPAPGSYEVSISGDFRRINFGQYGPDGGGDEKKILDVAQWGDIVWTDMSGAFRNASHLEVSASDAPDLSQVSSMNHMFASATSFNQDIGHWDMGNVTDFGYMFARASTFNQDISGWNMSSAVNILHMFDNATHFNQDIGGWDVSNVERMNGVFQNAESFNQDIGSWKTGNVTGMLAMFNKASSFNQDISGWDVSNVTDMRRMFSGASSFNQDISGWQVENVTDMTEMFRNATSFDQDLGDWNLAAIQDDGDPDERYQGLRRMLNNAGLSAENYENTLQGWAANENTPPNLILGAETMRYCAAAQGRETLITDLGWAINGDVQAPCTVELARPADQAVSVSVVPDFTWFATPDADYYEFRIARDAGMDSLVTQESDLADTVYSMPADLNPETDYYWQVRTVWTNEEEADYGNWSEAWNFRTSPSYQTSGRFTLTDKRYGASSDWTATIQAMMGSDYRVGDWNDLVAYHERGEDLLEMLDGLGATERETVAFVTRNGTAQHTSTRWYLFSRHEGNVPTSYTVHDDIANNLLSLGSWDSDRAILGYNINRMYQAPDPGLPEDESVQVSLRPQFQWEHPADTDSIYFELIVADNPGFTDPVVEQQEIETKALVASTRLQGETEYYWKVRTTDREGVAGDWSETYQFTTSSEPEPVDPPDAPVLVYPYDGQTGRFVNQTLQWQSVGDADSYQVRLYGPEEQLLVDSSGIAGHTYVAGDLQAGTSYAWQVRAARLANDETPSDSLVYGDWSEKWTFATAARRVKLAGRQPVQPTGSVIEREEMGLRLGIPQNALSVETDIEYGTYADIPPGRKLAGPMVFLGPAGTTFDEPVDVTLSYDPDSLDAETDPHDLVVLRYDAGEDAWHDLPSTTDTEAQTVTGTTTQFSGFAAGETDDSEPTPVPPEITIPEGSGTDEDPYLIAELGNLLWISENPEEWDKFYHQTDSINAAATQLSHNGDGFHPIGTYSEPFTGYYNGRGYLIDSLYISRSDEDYQGFFGNANGAEIKNVALENATVSGNDLVGVLSGLADNETVITSSYGSGTITGTSDVGGLTGALDNTSVLANSYSRADAEGVAGVGGLVGSVSQASIEHSYSTGIVIGSSNSGGLAGVETEGSVLNSYWDTESSETEESALGEGRTTSEMTWPYADNSFSGWDLDNYWEEDADSTRNDGYPALQMKDLQPPVVITLDASYVSTNSFWSGGHLTSDGGSEITEQGLVWDTSPNPDVENHQGKAVSDSDSALYHLPVEQLAAGRQYYYRAYATNSTATAYGEELTDTTRSKPDGLVYLYSGSQKNEVHKTDPGGNRLWSYTGLNSNISAMDTDNKGYVYPATSQVVHKIDSLGTFLWEYTGHSSAIRAVAAGSDGYSYSGSMELHKVDPDGGQVWVNSDYADRIVAMALDHDGHVYIGTEGGELGKIDADGNNVWSYTGHTDAVEAVAVDNEGYVYSGSNDGELHKVDSTGNKVWAYAEHGDWVSGISVDDAGYVYLASYNGEIHKTDPFGNFLWSYSGHEEDVWPLNLTGDAGGYSYIGYANGEVHKLDPEGERVWIYEGHDGQAVWSLSVAREQEPVAPPATPVLVYPYDGQTGRFVNQTLQWQSVGDADSYQVQLYGPEEQLLVDSSGIAGHTYVAGDLQAGTSYAWQVRAARLANDETPSDSLVYGEWSEQWSFTTAEHSIELAGRQPVQAAGSVIERQEIDLRLVIPEQALSVETDIEYGTYADIPPGRRLAGPMVFLGPAGTTFDEPVGVTLSYDPDSLEAETDPHDLVVLRYDAGEDAWHDLPSTTDTEAQTVTGTTTRFSGFAAGEKEQDETEPEPEKFLTLFDRSAVSGNLPEWFGEGHTERGMTAGGDVMYVVGRHEEPFVQKIVAQTGEDLSRMNLEGIEGGTFPVNDAGLTGDGHLLVGNYTNDSEEPFKVYQVHETDQPVTLITLENTTNARLGENLTVKGNLDDSTVRIYAPDGNSLNVYLWTIDGDDGTFGDPEIISLTGSDKLSAAPSPAVAPLPDGSFYWTAVARGAHRFEADGMYAGHLPTGIVSTTASDLTFIGTGSDGQGGTDDEDLSDASDGDPSKTTDDQQPGSEVADEFIAVYQYGDEKENVRVIRLPEGDPSSAELVFETPSLEAVNNMTLSGSVASAVREDGEFEVFVLSTNNGVAGYRSAGYELEKPDYGDPGEQLPAILSTPEDGASNVALQPEFSWHAAAAVPDSEPESGPEYTFQLSTRHDFPDEQRYEAAGLTDTTYVPGDSLQPGTDYFWRVGYESSGGEWLWSDTHRFTTDSQVDHRILSWMKQPTPVDTRLRDSHFIDARHGWAVGSEGVLLQSADGGRSWELRDSGTDADLESIAFGDSLHGVAVGRGEGELDRDVGTILRTTDGGQSWHQSEPAENGLHHVAMKGDKVWMAGRHGTVLRSEDGATSWQMIETPVEADLRSIHFADEYNGWAVGNEGTILYTEDGGLTWNIQDPDTDEDIWSVHAVNPLIAWAVGTNGQILRTRDGGQTWQQLPSKSDQSLLSVRFVNAATGWVVGGEGTVLFTDDGGDSWKQQDSGVSNMLYGLDAHDDRNAWSVGTGGTVTAYGEFLLHPVTLSQPSDKQDSVAFSPEFSWHHLEEAETYEIQLSADSLFTERLISHRTAGRDTVFQADIILDPETRYFWRVRGYESDGEEGLWSPVWSFTVRTQTPVDHVVTEIGFTDRNIPNREKLPMAFSMTVVRESIKEAITIRDSDDNEYGFDIVISDADAAGADEFYANLDQPDFHNSDAPDPDASDSDDFASDANHAEETDTTNGGSVPRRPHRFHIETEPLRAADEIRVTLQSDRLRSPTGEFDFSGNDTTITFRTALLGDFVGDDRVSAGDLAELVDRWQMTAGEGDIAKYDIGPAAGAAPLMTPEPDGVIDFEDLIVFAFNWHRSLEKNAGEQLFADLKDSGYQKMVEAAEAFKTEVMEDGNTRTTESGKSATREYDNDGISESGKNATGEADNDVASAPDNTGEKWPDNTRVTESGNTGPVEVENTSRAKDGGVTTGATQTKRASQAAKVTQTATASQTRQDIQQGRVISWIRRDAGLDVLTLGAGRIRKKENNNHAIPVEIRVRPSSPVYQDEGPAMADYQEIVILLARDLPVLAYDLIFHLPSGFTSRGMEPNAVFNKYGGNTFLLAREDVAGSGFAITAALIGNGDADGGDDARGAQTLSAGDTLAVLELSNPGAQTVKASLAYQFYKQPGEALDGVLEEELDFSDPVPDEFKLLSNYPNPFNPATNIRYHLPEAAHVQIRVYDVLGRRVTRLTDTRQEAGYYETRWDATRNASGVYLYEISVQTESGERFRDVKKMMLIK